MSRISSLHSDAFGDPGAQSTIEPKRGLAAWSDYGTLTKSRITAMVVLTAAVGFALAGSAGTRWTWLMLAGALVGTGLSCMGAAALNQLIEREVDRRMPRTQSRPLPDQRMSWVQACWVGCGLSIAGVGILLITTNVLAAAISAMTVLSYVFIYTPMKPRSPLALFVGAVPGAAPPLIGYAAAAHTLSPGAWTIFALMFIWQIPHFLAIGWLYRDDYARAKMPMIPVIDRTGRRTGRHIVLGCALLLAVSLLPVYLGLAGMGYLLTALVLSVGFLVLGIGFWLKPTRPRAKRVFLASLVHLPLTLLGFVLALI